jgi:hypothetical protein
MSGSGIKSRGIVISYIPNPPPPTFVGAPNVFNPALNPLVAGAPCVVILEFGSIPEPGFHNCDESGEME